MAIYAIVDANGKVINCIEWDGVSKWQTPSNTKLILNQDASIGDLYDFNTQTFTKFYNLPGYVFQSRMQ